jgi:hypothetical protein
MSGARGTSAAVSVEPSRLVLNAPVTPSRTSFRGQRRDEQLGSPIDAVGPATRRQPAELKGVTGKALAADIAW